VLIYSLTGPSKLSTRCASCAARNSRMKQGDKAVGAMFLGSGLKSLPRLSEEQLMQLRTAIDAELSSRASF